MIHAELPASTKRSLLKEALANDVFLQFPGAFNPLSGRLIQAHGFDGVYISGAVLSAELGLPDIGLTTLTEVGKRAQETSRVINLPTLVDADTGFGEPMNVARTTQILEDAGVSALHLEDQVNPKRCGHLDGKAVVDEDTAVKRIRSAVDARRDTNMTIVARTDIRSIAGFEQTIRRAKALRDAGADAIFPEALASLDEYELVASEVGLPIIANMTEFGKTELYPADDLRNAGVKIAIYPVSLLRVAMGAADRALSVLKSQGSLESVLPDMQTRAELYDLLDYESYNRFDSSIYNFSLPHNKVEPVTGRS